MRITDLCNMPGFNDLVSNGAKSVSKAMVQLKEYSGKLYPSCIKHGAMNKVSADGIWRCLMCNEGCFELKP